MHEIEAKKKRITELEETVTVLTSELKDRSDECNRRNRRCKREIELEAENVSLRKRVRRDMDYSMRMCLANAKSYEKNIEDVTGETCDWSMVSFAEPKNDTEKHELIRRLKDMVFFWETEASRYNQILGE